MQGFLSGCSDGWLVSRGRREMLYPPVMHFRAREGATSGEEGRLVGESGSRRWEARQRQVGPQL